MHGNEIRTRLHDGRRVYGTHIVSLGNPVAAKMTAELEIDFAFICAEHMPIDRTEISMMCQFYAAHGISPMVRIPYPSAHWATMVLDAGAQGVVAPYVETLQQVRELIGAVHYRPIKGQFLRALLDGTREAKPKLQQFWQRFNQHNYLILGIESVAAIDRLETLIAPDGVDGVFLGPHDITCSMEIPEEYQHPEFVSTVRDVIRRCRRLNKGIGIHYDLTSKVCRPFLETDMNLMLHYADVAKMRQQMNTELQILRRKFGDHYQRQPTPTPQNGCTT